MTSAVFSVWNAENPEPIRKTTGSITIAFGVTPNNATPSPKAQLVTSRTPPDHRVPTTPATDSPTSSDPTPIGHVVRPRLRDSMPKAFSSRPGRMFWYGPAVAATSKSIARRMRSLGCCQA